MGPYGAPESNGLPVLADHWLVGCPSATTTNDDGTLTESRLYVLPLVRQRCNRTNVVHVELATTICQRNDDRIAQFDAVC